MNNAMQSMLNYLNSQIGYLEKKSNANLDDKTANAGSKNYTKYARDYAAIGAGNYQAQAWCDMFADMALIETVGVEKAREMLGGFSAYTPTSANNYKKMGRWYSSPELLDQVFFKNSSRICHTGWVVEVTPTHFYTVEGNTSNASGVVANGGGVAKKKYALGYSKVAGFGRPDWDSLSDNKVDLQDVQIKLKQALGIIPGDATLSDAKDMLQKALGIKSTHVVEVQSTPVAPAVQSGNNGGNYIISLGQQHCNNFCGAGLDPDGIRGVLTTKGGIMALQNALNLDYGAGLVVDGIFGTKTLAALGKHYVKNGETQYMVTALEILLMLKGYDPKGVECPGVFGSGLENAVRQYQSDNGLTVDGVAGANTFKSLIS